jgi:protein-disulfide isomerase
MIKQVLEQYGEKIRFIYRNYPLPSHKLSKKAALAAEAAGEQGKYWEYHDKLFENQSVWSNESDPTKTFILYAKEIGLDLNKFSNSLENKKFQGRIETDVAVGNTVNIIQTPTFFINGMRLSDWTSFDQFKTEIEKRM